MSEADPDNLILGVQEAAEIMVDGYRGAMSNGQIVKLNFFSNRFDGGETVKRAAFTMVTSVSDFVAIARAFQELVETFERDGVFKVVSADGSEG